jgi:hypothetical protein
MTHKTPNKIDAEDILIALIAAILLGTLLGPSIASALQAAVR